MENKTKNDVTKGLFWTFGVRITAQLISTIVGIVLARVLDPEHYGIIAIVTVFITFFNVFVTSGFSSAVVQKKDVDDLDYDTAFYIGLAVSIIAYIILFFTSNFIADFYKMPDLGLVIKVMSIRLPLAALNATQQAYVRRKMEFKKFFIATSFGTIISGFVGIAMALSGFGVWALVAQYLTNTTTFSFQTISERLREDAFLLKGMTIELIDERTDKDETYQYEKGLEEFIDWINNDKEAVSPIISFDDTNNEIEVEIAMQFTQSYQENIISFVNLVRTGDGGTHEVGFRSGLTKVFNEYARKYALLKTKDKNLEGSDVREGLNAIISVKIPEKYLQFEGQTKSKLGSPIARNILENVTFERITYFLEENKDIAEKLIEKMIKAANARQAARKAKEQARKGKNNREAKFLSGKLAPAQSKNKRKNELYLVEGDSAGGSAKQGRDRKFQAILPLRGKVINTEKATQADILKNEEISTMINTINAGVGADFNVDDSAYDKIIIMTDADTDGAHIQILLLTFFYRYMRGLIKAGKVYIAMPPLYKVSKKSGKKDNVIYCWDEKDLEAARKKMGRGYDVQRYKGLGEMNAEQLWETTMNPETRTLIQVTIDDAAIVERSVSVLMGDKVQPRREWIENNVQFSLEDSFFMEG